MSQLLFVTGTDTNIGKTLVTALLAFKFRQMGLSVGVCKPFASGCEWENGVLVSQDAKWLKTTLDLSESLDEINPIALEKPLAPLVAARLAGVSTLDFKPIARATIRNLARKYDRVLVEGVGGIAVPVGEFRGKIWSIGDFARELDCDSVVVARRSLGTINHTLLTVETVSRPVGLIFCDAEPIEKDDLAARTSVALLAEMTKLPVWGEIPFLKKKNAATLEKVAALLDFG